MENKDRLAATLEALRHAVARGPTVIGSHVSVTVGPGATGSVIGEHVSVTVGPGHTGNVIGKKVSVTVGKETAAAMAAIRPEYSRIERDLAEAIEALRTADAPRSRFDAILARIGALGDLALEKFVTATATALGTYYGSGKA